MLHSDEVQWTILPSLDFCTYLVCFILKKGEKKQYSRPHSYTIENFCVGYIDVARWKNNVAWILLLRDAVWWTTMRKQIYRHTCPGMIDTFSSPFFSSSIYILNTGSSVYSATVKCFFSFYSFFLIINGSFRWSHSIGNRFTYFCPFFFFILIIIII